MHRGSINTYTWKLDKHQMNWVKLKMTISDSDKVDYFVKNMYDCGLLEAKLL